jgi:hypothetical protein
MTVRVAGARPTIDIRIAPSVENAPSTTADGTTDGRSDIDQIPPANETAMKGVRSGAATTTTTAADLQAKSGARRALPTTVSAVRDRVILHATALRTRALMAHLFIQNVRQNLQRAARALQTRGKEDPRAQPR